MSAAEQYIPAPPAPGELIPADAVERDAWIDARLEEARELERRIALEHQVAERRVAMIRANEEQQVAGLVAERDGLLAMLREQARVYEFTRGKSRRFAFGEIGRRLRALSIEITDEAAALDYAAGADLPIRVEVSTRDRERGKALAEWAHAHGVTPRESIGKAELQEHVRARRQVEAGWKPESDAGWSVAGGEDEPFVKVLPPEMG